MDFYNLSIMLDAPNYNLDIMQKGFVCVAILLTSFVVLFCSFINWVHRR